MLRSSGVMVWLNWSWGEGRKGFWVEERRGWPWPPLREGLARGWDGFCLNLGESGSWLGKGIVGFGLVSRGFRRGG